MSGPPSNKNESATDLWTSLRRLTAARIGLERSGASLATAPLLDFRLAHARARDAVNAGFDVSKLVAGLSDVAQAFVGASAAPDKRAYLMRPDLGRLLSPETEAALRGLRAANGFDAAVVVSDGLSAQAVNTHAVPVLNRIVPAMEAAGLTVAPIAILHRGRVAIGDRVANIVGACCVIVLIGERPGLSAPDSMGAYLTYAPDARTTDADRNCITNIRPEGVGYDDAAHKLMHLLRTIRAAGKSGVAIKDTSDRPALAP